MRCGSQPNTYVAGRDLSAPRIAVLPLETSLSYLGAAGHHGAHAKKEDHGIAVTKPWCGLIAL